MANSSLVSVQRKPNKDVLIAVEFGSPHNIPCSSLVPYHVLGPRVENQYIGETTN